MVFFVFSFLHDKYPFYGPPALAPALHVHRRCAGRREHHRAGFQCQREVHKMGGWYDALLAGVQSWYGNCSAKRQLHSELGIPCGVCYHGRACLVSSTFGLGGKQVRCYSYAAKHYVCHGWLLLYHGHVGVDRRHVCRLVCRWPLEGVRRAISNGLWRASVFSRRLSMLAVHRRRKSQEIYN